MTTCEISSMTVSSILRWLAMVASSQRSSHKKDKLKEVGRRRAKTWTYLPSKMNLGKSARLYRIFRRRM